MFAQAVSPHHIGREGKILQYRFIAANYAGDNPGCFFSHRCSVLFDVSRWSKLASYPIEPIICSWINRFIEAGYHHGGGFFRTQTTAHQVEELFLADL